MRLATLSCQPSAFSCQLPRHHTAETSYAKRTWRRNPSGLHPEAVSYQL